ncbi:PP2C family protein-serine/threonine phosphatase [Streptomyces werraensis]|uniref:PP2C family protein-serine/threonine phosphatase n=1 Tax=Streptomyces werraensis TaxID=68284 RepID=UPI0037D53089
MKNYASAQNTGGRDNQCDATAVRTGRDGIRAYALLDGIGSSSTVRDWTRNTAVRLARRAARAGDAGTALRALRADIASEEDRQDEYLRRYMPSAAAVVAVTAPGKPLTVAWAGDSRAYLLRDGIAQRLTEDHNARRVWPPTATSPGGSRNLITSYLGRVEGDDALQAMYGHNAVDTIELAVKPGDRIVLASDGAYEPHEDAGHDLVVELAYEPPASLVRPFVDLAVATSQAALPEEDHRFVDNATVLVADLTP